MGACKQEMAHLQAELAVDLEGLLEHLVSDGSLANSWAVELVKPLDVVSRPRLDRLHAMCAVN